MNSNTATPALDWQGPGVREGRARSFKGHTLLWLLVFPPKRHRLALTVPGFFLMVLAIGIGSAAYNTASNILFITLSLLLACLLLSGLLSWFNFMGVCSGARPPAPPRCCPRSCSSPPLPRPPQHSPTSPSAFKTYTPAPPPPAATPTT